jgi:hypothetical protein
LRLPRWDEGGLPGPALVEYGFGKPLDRKTGLFVNGCAARVPVG